MVSRFVPIALAFALVATAAFASPASEGEEAAAPTEQEMVRDPATGEMVTAPEYGGTITVSMDSDPTTLDPWENVAAVWAVSATYEKLGIGDWTIDRDEQDFFNFVPLDHLVPNLASSWEQPSPTEYVFHVREGVRWQEKPPVNGRELTAEDIAWSFHRGFGKGSGFTEQAPTAVYRWDKVESITARDRYTVDVKLSAPDLGYLYGMVGNSCETSWIMPREVWEEHGSFNDWRTMVGTGPYMVTDRVVDSSWTFTKHPNYHRQDEKYPEYQLPYADTFRILIIPDAGTRLVALQSGQIDFIDGLTQTQVTTLGQTHPDIGVNVGAGQKRAYHFDVSKPPFDDIRVRRAMQMALPIEEINDTYYDGNGDPTPSGMVANKAVGYTFAYDDWPAELKEDFEYNPERARQLLAESGYPDGFTSTLDITEWLCCGGDVELTQIVKAYWADIGVDVELNVMDLNTMIGIWNDHKLNPVAAYLMSNQYDPIATLNYTFISDHPWAIATVHAPDEGYEAEVVAMNEAATADEQRRMIRDLDRYIIEQFWAVQLPNIPLYNATSPWLKGYNGERELDSCGGRWQPFARSWVDQDLKAEMGR